MPTLENSIVRYSEVCPESPGEELLRRLRVIMTSKLPEEFKLNELSTIMSGYQIGRAE